MLVGSLFTGCGGLDLGLELAGWEIAWACEKDKHCRRVIEARWPGLEVSDDVRAVDRGFPEVTLLAGGFPCQDLSHAGTGAGLSGERSGLWFAMADAIRALEPPLVLIENVPGIFTKMGSRPNESAFGTVVADLAEAGYVGSWLRLRASDVGGCHKRERVFILAAHAGSSGRRQESGGAQGDEGSAEGRRADEDHVAGGARSSGLRAADGAAAADPAGGGLPEGRRLREAGTGLGRGRPSDDGRPTDAYAAGAGLQGPESARRRLLLAGSSESAADADGERAESGRGRRTQGGTDSRPVETELDRRRLVGEAESGPWEALADADGPGLGGERVEEPRGVESARRGEPDRRDPLRELDYETWDSWGEYDVAVRRWERTFGRPAPRPADDRGRLSPWFEEWMMGFPHGWTDVEGVGRPARLRMIGNAVMVQCAEIVGRMMLDA